MVPSEGASVSLGGLAVGGWPLVDGLPLPHERIEHPLRIEIQPAVQGNSASIGLRDGQ